MAVRKVWSWRKRPLGTVKGDAAANHQYEMVGSHHVFEGCLGSILGCSPGSAQVLCSRLPNLVGQRPHSGALQGYACCQQREFGLLKKTQCDGHSCVCQFNSGAEANWLNVMEHSSAKFPAGGTSLLAQLQSLSGSSSRLIYEGFFFGGGQGTLFGLLVDMAALEFPSQPGSQQQSGPTA